MLIQWNFYVGGHFSFAFLVYGFSAAAATDQLSFSLPTQPQCWATVSPMGVRGRARARPRPSVYMYVQTTSAHSSHVHVSAACEPFKNVHMRQAARQTKTALYIKKGAGGSKNIYLSLSSFSFSITNPVSFNLDDKLKKKEQSGREN